MVDVDRIGQKGARPEQPTDLSAFHVCRTDTPEVSGTDQTTAWHMNNMVCR